jgi:hypothetical protein
MEPSWAWKLRTAVPDYLRCSSTKKQSCHHSLAVLLPRLLWRLLLRVVGQVPAAAAAAAAAATMTMTKTAGVACALVAAVVVSASDHRHHRPA